MRVRVLPPPSLISFSGAKNVWKSRFAWVCIGVINAHIIRHEAARRTTSNFVGFRERSASYVGSNDETLGACGTKGHGKIAAEAIRGIGGSTAFD